MVSIDGLLNGKLNIEQARLIEGFALGLQQMILSTVDINIADKSYDPLTVSEDGTRIKSYSFDMCNGGRVHLVSDYKSVRDVLGVLSREAYLYVAENMHGEQIVLDPNKTISPITIHNLE